MDKTIEWTTKVRRCPFSGYSYMVVSSSLDSSKERLKNEFIKENSDLWAETPEELEEKVKHAEDSD